MSSRNYTFTVDGIRVVTKKIGAEKGKNFLRVIFNNEQCRVDIVNDEQGVRMELKEGNIPENIEAALRRLCIMWYMPLPFDHTKNVKSYLLSNTR